MTSQLGSPIIVEESTNIPSAKGKHTEQEGSPIAGFCVIVKHFPVSNTVLRLQALQFSETSLVSYPKICGSLVLLQAQSADRCSGFEQNLHSLLWNWWVLCRLLSAGSGQPRDSNCLSDRHFPRVGPEVLFQHLAGLR